MKKRPLIIAVAVLLAVAAGIWIWRRGAADAAPVYRFASLTRGDLEAAVSATGTLSAVTTVQVGTQVSGKVVATMADFNDEVKKGQLIARIDPTLLQQAVRDAQAGLERNQAELEQAEREYERNEQLFQRKVLTEIEFNNAKYALAVARANVKSAQVTLDRARQNLSYTSIFAPIDGIVVERNVDIGQTVTASMSTPQLFLIANDLAQMQILASVDESDIGAIKPGQPVRFTVQAYPDQRFSGTVKQVRLQSKTTENVVNYTVVVSVTNPDGRLLPGMTATLEFLTGSASDVLLAPNAALRFRPTDEMRAEVRERMQNGAGGQTRSANAESGRGADGDSQAPAGSGAMSAERAMGSAGGARNGAGAERRSGAEDRSGAGSTEAFGGNRTRRASLPTLWYLDASGKLAITRVRAGLTDGQLTEVEGPELKEGMQVIVGVNTPAQNNANNALGVFGPQAGPQGGGFQRRPGGF
jgi:HlyD family secretion protein